jgi:hypothetical protein
MLINESNDELLDRIESIVYILTERELDSSEDSDIKVLEKILHKVITHAIQDTVDERDLILKEKIRKGRL